MPVTVIDSKAGPIDRTTLEYLLNTLYKKDSQDIVLTSHSQYDGTIIYHAKKGDQTVRYLIREEDPMASIDAFLAEVPHTVMHFGLGLKHYIKNLPSTIPAEFKDSEIYLIAKRQGDKRTVFVMVSDDPYLR